MLCGVSRRREQKKRVHGAELIGLMRRWLGEDGTGNDFQISASDDYKAVVSGTTRQLHGVYEPGLVSSTGEHDDFEGLGRYIIFNLYLGSELGSHVWGYRCPFFPRT